MDEDWRLEIVLPRCGDCHGQDEFESVKCDKCDHAERDIVILRRRLTDDPDGYFKKNHYQVLREYASGYWQWQELHEGETFGEPSFKIPIGGQNGLLQLSSSLRSAGVVSPLMPVMRLDKGDGEEIESSSDFQIRNYHRQ